MAGGAASIALACMRAARHYLDLWLYAPQVPHASAEAFGALQIAALCPKAPHRSHLFTPLIGAPGGAGEFS